MTPLGRKDFRGGATWSHGPFYYGLFSDDVSYHIHYDTPGTAEMHYRLDHALPT